MSRVLVAFATSEGQTEHIAHHVAARLERRGHTTYLIDLGDHQDDRPIPDYDAAVLAGSLHRGAHQRELGDFAARISGQLGDIPSAFISVSLSAGSDDPDERDVARAIARRFCTEIDWRPDMLACVAGAVHDREMNFIERLIIHAILWQKGVEPDPSGDTEFTDWDGLDAFIDAFSKIAATGSSLAR